MELFKNVSIHFFLDIGLKTPMNGRDFIFGYIDTLYCNCHKVNLNCDGPYIDSPD